MILIRKGLSAIHHTLVFFFFFLKARYVALISPKNKRLFVAVQNTFNKLCLYDAL